MEGDVATLQSLIVSDITGEDANGKITGAHRSTGTARPCFWERAEFYGETGRLAQALATAGAHGKARRQDLDEERLSRRARYAVDLRAVGHVG